MPQFPLAFTANLGWMLLIFVFLMVALDLVLVRGLKLGKRAWKRVDYLWLILASLGLLGAVGQARQQDAAVLLPISVQRTNFAFQSLRAYIDDFAVGPAICRTFDRAQYSPPEKEFARIQGEFNSACDWFKKISSAIPRKQPEPPITIPPSALPRGPEITAPDLVQTIDWFWKDLSLYNTSANEQLLIESKVGHSEAEQLFIQVSPLLLAFALALRITKVTGELRTGP